MRHLFEELFCGPIRPQELTFLMATGADTSQFARKGNQKLVSAFWAPHPGETLFENPAIQESIYCILYNLSQVAKGWLKPLFVDLEKSLEIMCQRAVEDGVFRLTPAVGPT